MTAAEITDLRVSVARIEETVKRIDENIAESMRVRDDHENRLRRIERGAYVAVGLALAGGGAAGAISSILTGA